MSSSRLRRRDRALNLIRGSRKTSPNPASQPSRPHPYSAAPPFSTSPSHSHLLLPTPIGHKLFEKAIGALLPAQQATIRTHLVPNTRDVRAAVEEAYNAAEKQKQICDDKMWKWEFRGREVVLRDEAKKVLLWLDRFKSVGDVVANVAPLHVGLPWAGIRMILEVRAQKAKLYTAV